MKRWRRLYGTQSTFICPYCLKTFPISEATRDHKTAKSRGGKTDSQNIVLACKECNNEKGALSAQEYAEWKRLEFIRNGGLSR